MILKKSPWWGWLLAALAMLAVVLDRDYLRPEGTYRAIFFLVVGIALIAVGVVAQRLSRPPESS